MPTTARERVNASDHGNRAPVQFGADDRNADVVELPADEDRGDVVVILEAVDPHDRHARGHVHRADLVGGRRLERHGHLAGPGRRRILEHRRRTSDEPHVSTRNCPSTSVQPALGR